MNVSNTCFIDQDYPVVETGYEAIPVILSTVGTLAISTIGYYSRSLLRRNKTGKRNIVWAAGHISTGICSAAKNFHHGAALKLGVGDPSHHQRQATLSFQAGTNALHLLRGREDKLVLFMPDSKVLVKTVNRPKKECRKNQVQEKILQTITKLMPRLQVDYPYLEFDLSKVTIGTLSNGVCLGMVQQYIMNFTKLREANLGFIEAAEKVASIFKRGASKQACIFQYIQLIAELDTETFERLHPQDESTQLSYDLNKICARWLTAFFMNGFNVSSRTVTDLTEGGNEIQAFSDGCYLISNGMKVSRETPEQSIDFDSAHGMALIVENGQFLIFDPNQGLIQTPNPDRFFKIRRGGETGLLIIDKIVPKK
jgi:hypothetical protein